MLALLLLPAAMRLLLDTQPPAFSTLRICRTKQHTHIHCEDATHMNTEASNYALAAAPNNTMGRTFTVCAHA